MSSNALFLSTLSLRRATDRCKQPSFGSYVHFYPRSPCGERPHPIGVLITVIEISIHALLAESDNVCPHIRRFCAISIHALLAESDPPETDGSGDLGYFYPRSPCGERPIALPARRLLRHFYPRSPCGERLWPPFHAGQRARISIHALLAESDWPLRFGRWPTRPFLSTLSLRRATPCKSVLCRPPSDFYPRSPCGERHRQNIRGPQACAHFYPRSPCGERPLANCTKIYAFGISIHALLAESDVVNKLSPRSNIFLSTLSLRRATHCLSPHFFKK